MGAREPVKHHYAIVFAVQGDEVVAGSLRLTETGVLLSGGNGGRRSDLELGFDEIVDVRVGRVPAERLNGRSTLVLDRRGNRPVLVMPLGPGFLCEITEVLKELAAKASAIEDVLAVAASIRPGSIERARELLAEGPPIDPAALGLTGHQIYLRDTEVVFVFHGERVRETVQAAMRRPAMWRAGLAWRECITGRPHIRHESDVIPGGATPVYSWTATGGSSPP
jgi:hypothetical protein